MSLMRERDVTQLIELQGNALRYDSTPVSESNSDYTRDCMELSGPQTIDMRTSHETLTFNLAFREL